MAELEKAILNTLRQSKYTIVLSGYAMLAEAGYPEIRDGDVSYEIEAKYGYSAEEMLSSAFFSTRKEQFYKFYRNEILSVLDKSPGRGFYDLARLEQEGLIQTVITRRIFGLPERAGCRHVINMHGSVTRHYCTHCGREYPVEFIINAKKIPLCDVCEQAVRPDMRLYGEMVDNQVITNAAREVQKAEVLLVLGTHLKTYLCHQLVRYYEGDKLIMIHEEEHFSDKSANVLLYSRVDDALDKIINILEEEKNNHEEGKN